ncbi:MAG: class I SAM-dependent methyltransferase [Rhodocyclaceae bacterium]|nr:class I SAM-dependent methyltransferase [Rhodocyclaceae bacterium]
MDEKDIDLQPVARLYTKSLTEFGASPMGVGWRDTASQDLRFAKLSLQVLESAADGPVTVNDLGCGDGAMLKFLRRAGVDVARYTGYDVSPEMLAAAREQAGGEGTEYLLGSRLLHPADYSFASGIFNVRLEEDGDRWAEYIADTLRDLSARSTKGFAFNMLSTYVDFREPHLYYGDPLHYFDFCKRNFSRFVTLLHDYPLYEWTVVVRQEKR